MSAQELQPAIRHIERKVNGLIKALNVLRAEAGMPPYSPSPDDDGDKMVPKSLDIKSDTFFGKRQHTAIREYLEMRQASGDGPARPREIYDALKSGGFEFESTNVQTALSALRAMLRRRTNVFVKVGNTGAYGLVTWYPDAKPKSASRTSEEPSNGGGEEGALENSGEASGTKMTEAEDDEEASAA